MASSCKGLPERRQQNSRTVQRPCKVSHHLNIAWTRNLARKHICASIHVYIYLGNQLTFRNVVPCVTIITARIVVPHCLLHRQPTAILCTAVSACMPRFHLTTGPESQLCGSEFVCCAQVRLDVDEEGVIQAAFADAPLQQLPVPLVLKPAGKAEYFDVCPLPACPLISLHTLRVLLSGYKLCLSVSSSAQGSSPPS